MLKRLRAAAPAPEVPFAIAALLMTGCSGSASTPDPATPSGTLETTAPAGSPTEPGGSGGTPTQPGGGTPTQPGGGTPTQPGGGTPTQSGGGTPTEPGGETPTVPGVTAPPTAPPTPTAAPPAALSFAEEDIALTCDQQSWTLAATVQGWTAPDTAQLGIFDWTKFCESYGDVPDQCYREWHPVKVDASSAEPAYSEDLSLELARVHSVTDVVEGESTAFSCENKALLTYALCGEDYWYETGELCHFFGKEPSFWEANANPRRGAPEP